MIKVDGLKIYEITEGIFFVHQIKPPFYFSCADGIIILPKIGRNQETIVLDLNIEPKFIKALASQIGPISDYVCSHGHMDHIAHIHAWEEIGAKVWAPRPEATCLLDLKNFYLSFGFDEALEFPLIKKFGEINGYQKCNTINSFEPGKNLEFNGYLIETIPLKGHSKSHIGFYLPNENLLHISCLGFDLSHPKGEGFGPWYGFKECDINQYLLDIKKCEALYKEKAEYLTSSHSYIVIPPDNTPFEYMRDKIRSNKKKVKNALKELKPLFESEEQLINELLKKDIFFPKSKMKGFLLEIYKFWESWILKNHLKEKDILQ